MIKVVEGDCRQALRTLPDASVHCCVTSPPYYGLREYGTATWQGGDPACDHVVGAIRTGLGMAALGAQYRGGGKKQSEPKPMFAKGECPKCGARRIDRQIGLEPSPDEYVAEMVKVFREVRRVLRDDGTLWLNIGDCYASGPSGTINRASSTLVGSQSSQEAFRGAAANKRLPNGLKPKDLIGVPWLLAFALRADGWWLRKDIIWAKPNPMPESATDRPTSSHEHVFLLTKAPRYFFDAEAVREPAIYPGDLGLLRRPLDSDDDPNVSCHAPSIRKRQMARIKVPGGWDQGGGAHGTIHRSGRTEATYQTAETASGRNIRDVWTIATSPFPDAHFATFPPELAERCVLAGTSEKGCCAACGAPWRRIVTKGESDVAHRAASGADASGGYNGQSTKNHDAHGVQNASDVKRRILEGMRLKGYDWSLSCQCNAGPPVPCTVLDPFAGAFTALLVADRLQRNGIGIELNPEYCEMARRRLTKEAPLLTQIERSRVGLFG